MDEEEVTLIGDFWKKIDDFWKKIDEMHLSWKSPNCVESWPEMDDGYLLKLQRRDLGERITEVQKEEKLVITPSLIPSVLMHTHLRFNHGPGELDKNTIEGSYVPLNKQVADLLMKGWKRVSRQCIHCQRPVEMMRRSFNITMLAKRCREVILRDFLYLSKKESYILTMINSLSRSTVLHKCKNADASAVVKGLWTFHSYYELAEEFILVSDKGSHLLNQVVAKFVGESGGSQRFSCAYAPFTNGATEVQNRQILKHIRTLISELSLTTERWPFLVHKVQYYLNSLPMQSRGGLSQFQILLGKMPHLSAEHEKRPEEIILDLQEDLLKYQERAFSFANRTRQYLNTLYNKRYKLTTLCSTEEDFA
eukprot:snap_masked-scaffold_4-processed-gene-6.27-mRNA-1 protein AED:0.40 eAED:0.40 QI:0/0/0/0.5/1/1/2/0/364